MIRQIGALGTKLLIEMIEQRPPIEQIGLSYRTNLVIRQSTRQKPATES